MQLLLKPPGFDVRLRAAADVLQSALRRPRAAIFASFGKDSACVLGLAVQLAADFEVGYFQWSACETKHDFAKKVAKDLKASVCHLRPHSWGIIRGRLGSAVRYGFDLISGDRVYIVGATLDDAVNPGLVCGLQQPLTRTTSGSPYPWTTIITGRRRADWDDTVGSLRECAVVERLPHDTELVMPIAAWSDEDVAFFLQNCTLIPYDTRRYTLSDSRLRPRIEKTHNPDYAQMCIRCFSSVAETEVICPLNKPTEHVHANDDIYYDEGTCPPEVMF